MFKYVMGAGGGREIYRGRGRGVRGIFMTNLLCKFSDTGMNKAAMLHVLLVNFAF